MSATIRITSRRFKMHHRIMVVPNKTDDEWVWKIIALEGRDTGGIVAYATEVPLTGPVGCMPSTRGITGYLSEQPMWLTNATFQVDGAWSPSVVMDAAMLTSDGEVWTVNRRRTPEARVRFWDKDFNEIDFPRRWKIEVVNG